MNKEKRKKAYSDYWKSIIEESNILISYCDTEYSALLIEKQRITIPNGAQDKKIRFKDKYSYSFHIDLAIKEVISPEMRIFAFLHELGHYQLVKKFQTFGYSSIFYLYNPLKFKSNGCPSFFQKLGRLAEELRAWYWAKRKLRKSKLWQYQEIRSKFKKMRDSRLNSYMGLKDAHYHV